MSTWPVGSDIRDRTRQRNEEILRTLGLIPMMDNSSRRELGRLGNVPSSRQIHRRPPGRAPLGCAWNSSIGAYVRLDGQIVMPRLNRVLQSPITKKPETGNLTTTKREKLVGGNCSICLEDPAVVCFVPCGHICSCSSCASSVSCCPICRSHIDQKIEAYVS